MSRRNGTKSAVYVAGDFSGEAEAGWPFSGGIGEALIWGVGRAFFLRIWCAAGADGAGEPDWATDCGCPICRMPYSTGFGECFVKKWCFEVCILL